MLFSSKIRGLLCSAQLFERAENGKARVCRYTLWPQQREMNVSSHIKLGSFPTVSLATSFSNLLSLDSVYFIVFQPQTSCDNNMAAVGLDFRILLGSNPRR